MPKNQPIAKAPMRSEILQAFSVLGRWRLHYYQLLYSQNPPLTEPGNSQRPANPFMVESDSDGRSCLIFRCVVPEYTFLLFALQPVEKTQDMLDMEVIYKCKRAMQAIHGKLAKIDDRACCGLALRIECSCRFAYRCELHNEGHSEIHE